jgi:Beta-propeller repeat
MNTASSASDGRLGLGRAACARFWPEAAVGVLLAAGCVVVAGVVSGAAGARVASDGRQDAGAATLQTKAGADAYGALPLALVPNQGQLDPRVRFSAQAGAASFFFSEREAVVAFAGKKKGVALRLRFPGASPDVVVGGERQAPGRVNYLLGADPEKWRTNVPTYGEVRYRGLWPGIDLVFRGGRGELKYELHVAPGASLAQVRLAYAGARHLSLDSRGHLLIETALGTLRDSRPVSYQLVKGKRVPVASRFLLDGSSYGFAVPRYDRSRPLVIDPGLVYSTYLGGANWADYGYGIAVDGAGNAYVTGQTGSLDFPTTAGAFDTSFNGPACCGADSYDAFVAKLNAAGTALVYSTYLGGGGADSGSRIAVDGAGNAYVTGTTSSTDFPTTAGAFDRSANGKDAFLTKLNAAGSALGYSTYLGGSLDDMGGAIAVDDAGSAYVTGYTNSVDFPSTAGAFDQSFNGGYDAFVTKLNAGGSALGYSTFLGGNAFDGGHAVAVDGAGSAYVTGRVASADFPVSAGAFDTSFNGNTDAFVAKLNAAGSALGYATYLGGGDLDIGNGIAVDGTTNAYVTGSTYSGNFPTTAGAFDTSYNFGGDAFVTKLNAAGSALGFSTYLGGSGSMFSDETDAGRDIDVDAAGSAYVTGETTSDDFPTTPGAFDTTFNGVLAPPQTPYDAFVTKLNTGGSTLGYSTYLGGAQPDHGEAIAVDGAGNAYVTGNTSSTAFPTSGGAFDTSFDGQYDAFVARFDLGVVPGMNWAANNSVDFDADHVTDFALYRGRSPDDALWYAPGTAGTGPFQIYFGATSDVPVPGDYDGDGKTDAVIYRPSTGLWYGPRTGAAQIVIQMVLGEPGDIPIPGDYDGDGRTDPAIYRPSTGLFFGTNAAGSQVVLNTRFGAAGDVPVPRDYDGDGTTDPGIYRQDVTPDHYSLWYAPLSGGGAHQIYFGAPGDIPVPGDYDGDLKADSVIFRPSTGLWYGPRTGVTQIVIQMILGESGDIPIPGYYDSNLATDPAIFRPSTGLWFSVLSGGGTRSVGGMGTSGDVPIQKRPALAGGM